MRVYRRTYKRDGAEHTISKWYIDFVDHRGIHRRISGLTDKKASEALGRQIERLVAAKLAREPLSRDLSAWVETLSSALRSSLGRFGVLDGQRLAAGRTLKEHIEDWRGFLSAKDNTPRYVGMKISRMRKIVEGCRFIYWSDLAATRVMTFLNELRDGGNGISAQTSNFYLQGAKQFCRWMCRDGRATSNPLEYLEGLNVRTDRRHDRRALDVEEIRWLLDTTADGPTIRKLPGPTRALLYRLALETGLRAAELASLTRESFRLDTDPLTVTVAAGYSKHRREDTVPLRLETAAEVRNLLAVTLPRVPVFRTPNAERKRLAEVLKQDLDAAREKWIAEAKTSDERQQREASDFLAYRDSAGRVVDFHALRHTTGSLLAAAGVHPKVAQSIMRHSDINLTMSRYSHVYAGQEADAVAKLPDFGAPGKANEERRRAAGE